MYETMRLSGPPPIATASACVRQGSIVCDFDGTITPFDVTDAILTMFADPSWEALEQAWVAGEINAKECMDRQVRLIHASKEELDAFLDDVPLTPGFVEFAAFCQSRQFNLVVVSDGLDYAIRRILAHNAINALPVIANRLNFHDQSRYSLDFPYGSSQCGSGVCKCEVARLLPGKTLLIGDGRSDCCLAARASFVLARKGQTLLERCREENYPHMVWNDFIDVRTAMEQLMSHAGREAETATSA